MREKLFNAHFHRLQLCPLTEEQQREVIVKRLGAGENAEVLIDYVQTKVPLDTADSKNQQRVTGNPLMLSMVVSIFESRMQKATKNASTGNKADLTGASAQGHMPETISELYRLAAGAMLELR